MALTQEQVSQLYVAIFNRASEGSGNKNWQNQNLSMADTANLMLDTDDAKKYFGDSYNNDRDFIEHIYLNTLNKTPEQDPDGIQNWVNQLKIMSKGEVVAKLIEAIYTYSDAREPVTKAAYDQFVNRVEVSNYTADHFEGKDLPTIMPDYATKLGFKNAVHPENQLEVTNDEATINSAETIINNIAHIAQVNVYPLTSKTDIAEAELFSAPMVYTPDGSDRILSLQDEDQLTGEGDNATLNVVLGNINRDEGTTGTVTPTLKNIKNINVDWTGNTDTLDLRYADATKSIHLDKITSDAGAVSVNNIATDVTDLKVANAADVNTAALFTYKKGVLDGTDDKLDLTLDNILANSITQNSTLGTEGFEHVTVKASNGVYLNSLTVNELQDVKLTGSGDLTIVNLAPTAPTGGAPEYDLLGAGSGITTAGSAGIKDIDGSEFNGDIKLDISSAMGRNVDPNDSGAPFYGSVEGGKGDDTFYTSSTIQGNDAVDNGHNIIDGGEGKNTLVTTVGGIENDAKISNIQRLELRDQNYNIAYNRILADNADEKEDVAKDIAKKEASETNATKGEDEIWGTADDTNATTVDMDAFDASLTSVFMRDEDVGHTEFLLRDLTATQATSALTLAHATSDTAGVNGTGDTVVVAKLADAKGSDDTVALTIVNDKNKGNIFNYTLSASGNDTDNINPTTSGNARTLTTYDADAVENITIHDKDTESNTVTLTNIYDHTGKIILDGGTAGDTFAIGGTLNSATIDASAQASNLRLTVGDTVGTKAPITQDIKLGTGDDILTFDGLNEFDKTDSLNDAGGNDTVRAVFSKDSTLNLTGIENLQTMATENVKLDMSKADVTNLVILSNTAVDGDSDLDNNGVAEMEIVNKDDDTSDKIITLDNTKLTELNFFADADTDNIDDNIDESQDHKFNGVTLSNNTASDLTVNINTSLDYAHNDTKTYEIGQITTHGNKSMNIVVGNEQATAGATTTTINNIYAKNMETLTATATGDLNLGTISGIGTGNSLKTVDFSGVKGAIGTDKNDNEVKIISLGDNGTVKLGDGNHHLSVLGSSGKDIHITSGNGNSRIEGSAQSDTIITGSGDDNILGDRGNNIIHTGAGNDFVRAKDGNDTVDFGTGFGYYIDNLGTNLNASKATNMVSMQGGIVATYIDVEGNGKDNNDNDNDNNNNNDVNQILAVGNGSDLTVKWTGKTLDSAVLDGTTLTTTDNVLHNADNSLQIVIGNTNKDEFIGTDKSDGIVGSEGADTINAGKGADNIVLQNTSGEFDKAVDTVIIESGQSTATGYDTIVGFDTTSGDNNDKLDLATDKDKIIITTEGSLGVGKDNDKQNVGNIKFDNINKGKITFDSKVGTGEGEYSLKEALDFLSANIDNGETVLFDYDMNGDGKIDNHDSVFVFQDGASDTVVQITQNPLGDLNDLITGLSTTAEDHSIYLV